MFIFSYIFSKKNLHRTITKSISQPVEVNVHGNYQQKHNNNNNNNNNSINTNRITTINTPEQIRMPKAGKIASSIQDLTTSSMVATGLNSSNNYYNEMIRSTSGSNFSKFSTSEPDLQNRIVYDDNNYHSTAQTANEAGGYHYKNNNNNNNNNNNDIGFDTYYKSLSHLNVSHYITLHYNIPLGVKESPDHKTGFVSCVPLKDI